MNKISKEKIVATLFIVAGIYISFFGINSMVFLKEVISGCLLVCCGALNFLFGLVVLYDELS